MRQAAAMVSPVAALPAAMPSAQDGEEVRRAGLWAASTAVMALLHVGGLIAAVFLHPATRPVPPAPAMMIELAPMPAPAAAEPAPAPLPPEPVMPKPREAPPPMVKTAKPAPLKPKPNPVPPSQAHVDVPASPAEAAETSAVLPTSPGQNTPTSAPAPQARSTSASRQAVANWYGRLQAHLESRKRYPRVAQSRRQEGVATVRFVLDRLGNVLSARLEQSAGHALLDEESMDLVGRAQPLPPPPPEVTGERIEVSVPIEFFLK
jgi:TonB family C-terminal domain